MDKFRASGEVTDGDIPAFEKWTDTSTLESWNEMFTRLFEIPGSDQINMKNIITNPAALKKIFENMSWLPDSHKVDTIKYLQDIFSKCMHNKFLVNDPIKHKLNLYEDFDMVLWIT